MRYFSASDLQVRGMTNDPQPSQNYRKMYGTEPRYKELVIRNTIQETSKRLYLDITLNGEAVTALRKFISNNFCARLLSSMEDTFLPADNKKTEAILT